MAADGKIKDLKKRKKSNGGPVPADVGPTLDVNVNVDVLSTDAGTKKKKKNKKQKIEEDESERVLLSQTEDASPKRKKIKKEIEENSDADLNNAGLSQTEQKPPKRKKIKKEIEENSDADLNNAGLSQTEQKPPKRKKIKKEIEENSDADLNNAGLSQTEQKPPKRKKIKKEIEENSDADLNNAGLSQTEQKSPKRKKTKKEIKEENCDVDLKMKSKDISQPEITPQKRRKRGINEEGSVADVHSTDMSQPEESSKKKKKKRKSVEDGKGPGLESVQDVKNTKYVFSETENDASQYEIEDESPRVKVDNVTTLEPRLGNEITSQEDRGNKDQLTSFNSSAKKRLKSKENMTITKLLGQRTNVASELQVRRIESVCDQVSFHDVLVEHLPKLKKKMLKKADMQKEGNDRKVKKLDAKIKKLKEEVIVEASELKGDAIKKLEAIEKSIVRKMKKKSRKKSFNINEMVRDRLSKGKTGLGLRCQDGITALKLRSKEARSEVKQASNDTKKRLEEQLKTFIEKIEKLQVQELDNAFSGAAIVRGYLC